MRWRHKNTINQKVSSKPPFQLCLYIRPITRATLRKVLQPIWHQFGNKGHKDSQFFVCILLQIHKYPSNLLTAAYYIRPTLLCMVVLLVLLSTNWFYECNLWWTGIHQSITKYLAKMPWTRTRRWSGSFFPFEMLLDEAKFPWGAVLIAWALWPWCFQLLFVPVQV